MKPDLQLYHWVTRKDCIRSCGDPESPRAKQDSIWWLMRHLSFMRIITKCVRSGKNLVRSLLDEATDPNLLCICVCFLNACNWKESAACFGLGDLAIIVMHLSENDLIRAVRLQCDTIPLLVERTVESRCLDHALIGWALRIRDIAAILTERCPYGSRHVRIIYVQLSQLSRLSSPLEPLPSSSANVL